MHVRRRTVQVIVGGGGAACGNTRRPRLELGVKLFVRDIFLPWCGFPRFLLLAPDRRIRKQTYKQPELRVV